MAECAAAFTCISCRVAFAEADLQRAHYKSDWHRYNLKRKVAELPPVTADNFQQRVLAQRAQQSEQENQNSYCKLCAKSFSSKNAYENHLQSKKHRECGLRQEKKQQNDVEKLNEKNLEKDMSAVSESRLKDVQNEALKAKLRVQGAGSLDTQEGQDTQDDMDTDNESEESWDGEALGLEECLFCSHVSKTMDANISHMTRLHSFFIPDLEYVCDLEGLIVYLGEKVGEGHICLWCNEKTKTFLSVKSVQQHMQDKGHCKMIFEGDAIFEYSDYYDYRESYPDQNTSQSTGEEGESEEVAPELLSEDNFQLVLPSGSAVGHRSLQRYYRQKLKPERVRVSSALSRVMAQYRALGWTGTTGVDAQKRARDMAFVQRMKAHRLMRISIKSNKMQKFFRDDNFGIRH